MSLLATTGPSALWYLARGTGAVALILLSASVILGVLGSIRFSAGERWPRFTIDALHRDVSLLVIAVIAVHVLTSVLDGFAPIGLLDAVVPLHSSYRSLWLGLGALAFDLLLALAVTSLVRRRLGFRAWKAIHWLAYASWPVAVLHGIGTGSDTRVWWMLALTAVCMAAVLAAIFARVLRAQMPAPGLARLVAGAAALGSVALAVFTVAGPLQPGWARKAGTPASLLGGNAARVFIRAARPAPGRRPLEDFSAALAGQLRRRDTAGGTILDLALGLSQGARGELRVRLAGTPDGSGGVSLTGSQVDLALAGQTIALQGKVLSLVGTRIRARVSGVGADLVLDARLQIDSGSGSVSGSLSARRVA